MTCAAGPPTTATTRRGLSAPLPRGVVVGGLVVGVAAVSWSAVLVRLADAPPLAIGFWRCAVGAAVLAPFAARGGALAAGWRQERAGLVGAGLLLALHFALFIGALSLTSVAAATLLGTASPLFVGIGGALFLGEPPSGRAWAGIAVAIAGAAAVGIGDASMALSTGGRAVTGDVMALAGAAAVGGYLLLGRRARRTLPVAAYGAVVYGVAAVVLLAACLATRAPLAGYDRGTWLALGGLVVGPQLLGHTVFNGLLSTLSATVVAVVVLAEPVAASLLAWAVLGEMPPSGVVVGGPLVLAGVFLAASSPPRL